MGLPEDTPATARVQSDYTVSLAKPEIGWIPYALARFRWCPEFTLTPEDYFVKMRSLIEAAFPPHLCPSVADAGDRSIHVSLGMVRWTIHGYNGTFSLEQIHPDIDFDYRSVFKGISLANMLPEVFFDKAREAGRPIFEPDNAITLLQFAEVTFNLIAQQFSDAVQKGDAVVFGRKQSHWSPFTKVEIDQFKRLSFEYSVSSSEDADVEVSDAFARLGPHDVVFFIHIKPIVRQKTGQENIENAAVEWLIDLMRNTQESRHSKAELKVEARKMWPSLSDKKFNNIIWTSAKRAIPGNKYGRAGARKKSKPHPSE